MRKNVISETINGGIAGLSESENSLNHITNKAGIVKQDVQDNVYRPTVSTGIQKQNNQGNAS